MHPPSELDRDVRRVAGDEGASLVEYALLMALIALVCISAVTFFQDQTTNKLSSSASTIHEAGN